jgi:hypothetical protein
MFRRLGLVAAALFALVVPAAQAAYPSPYAERDGKGILSADGTMRFNALTAAGNQTTITNGKASRTIAGEFGIPMVTTNVPGGLFRDGSTFMLQSVGSAKQTTFQLVNTGDLAIRDTITLDGTFAYDALSPNSKTLYLIQHTSVEDVEHYIVRAYDIGEHSLRPGRIADKAQKSWVMQGWPVTRATTKNGRWAYTMYLNPGGYPFVHALDTVRGTAHCVGFAWPTKNQPDLLGYRLSLAGKKLRVLSPAGATWRAINTKTWKVTTR